MVKELLSRFKAQQSFILFLCLYILASFIGMYYTPLFDEDEGFFAEAARHLLATSDYITVTVNGELRYDKPALFFWFTALSMKIFGQNEFAVRLPSFIFFLCLLRLLYHFGKKYLSQNAAQNAIIITISLVQFQVLSRQ